MKLTPFAVATTLVVAALPAVASAQSRTPWQQNDGEGLVSFYSPSPARGAVVEYGYATIPPADDQGWRPAPDVDYIGYSVASTLCGQLECRYGAEFTYFQTYVDIPAGTAVNTFTIDFQGIDDGARTTIFNSRYPDGVVVPGSYVYLGGSGTANLASLVVAGETNRVVVTHVDDCCIGSYLSAAYVVLDGYVVDSCTDPDDDGVCEPEDNCPDTANPDQADGDGDGVGDACTVVCTVVQRGTYGSVKDTYVNVQVPGESGGNYPYLYTGTHTSGDKLSLLQFDLDFIPPWSLVTSAKVTLSQQYKSFATSTVRVHEASGFWSEANTSYRNFVGYNSAVESSFLARYGDGGTVSFDLTGLAQGWVNTAPNNGVVLEENRGASRSVFRASEHATVSLRPKLEICYIPFLL
jgi:hypothetical protein